MLILITTYLEEINNLLSSNMQRLLAGVEGWVGYGEMSLRGEYIVVNVQNGIRKSIYGMEEEIK